MKHIFAGAVSLFFAVTFQSTSFAQSPFSAAIKVNDGVITRYELAQRTRFLDLLKFPGVPSELAKTQLIEESLKRAAAKSAGIEIGADQMQSALEEFAGRVNLTPDAFIAELAGAGVDRYTLEQFVETNQMWIELVRLKFGRQSVVSDAQLDRSVKSETSGTEIEVLLTEIIMAVNPFNQEDVQAKAIELSQMRSIDKFSQAAREFSDAPTRDLGGKVTWQKLNALPPILQPLVFGLAPGDVTEPLAIPNALALFQMRGIRETQYVRPKPGAIDFARYSVPFSDQSILTNLSKDVAHCDDLYAWAKGHPNHILDRQSQTLQNLAPDMVRVLSNLDDNEFTIRNLGSRMELTMLCARTPTLAIDTTDLNAIRSGLRNKRLENLADSFLENLRQDARISFQ